MTELKTERLILKPLGPEYLDTTHKYSSDLDNCRLMVFLPNESLEETLQFLVDAEAEWSKENPSYYEFAIILNDTHIGAISLYLEDEGETAELGWILDKAYHGRGYTTEAAKALIKYASENMGIHHFIAHCDSENAASYSVMEKLGMIRTDTHMGRKNRSSDEERKEYLYEKTVNN